MRGHPSDFAVYNATEVAGLSGVSKAMASASQHLEREIDNLRVTLSGLDLDCGARGELEG